MIQIRHLLAIVFLWCGMTAQGNAKVYDQSDMVGTYNYEIPEYILNLHLHSDDTFMIIDHDSYMRLGTWEITENIIVLHFDNTKLDSLQTHHDLDKFVAKELEIMDKNTLFWGFYLHKGIENRVELARHDKSKSSPKSKNNKEFWKELVEQIIMKIIE